MAEPFTVLKLSETHEWRLRGRRWELHYLPADDGMPLRTASRFEAELLDAAKREVDAASGVTPCDEAQQEYEPVGDFIARPQPDGEPLWERTAD